MRKAKATAFPAPAHDHAACVSDINARAEAVFDARGLRLTGLRRSVLEEIAASHHAVGAYEVLDRLARKSGARLAPISVYRAIEALSEAGLVHRLESRNAYFACTVRHDPAHQQLVLACQACGSVAEVAAEPVFEAIATVAEAARFRRASALVEVLGTCRHCADGAAVR